MNQTYTFHYEIILPISRLDAWDFFSNPKNLARLTPEKFNMQLSYDETKPLHRGQEIKIRVSPFPFFTTSWVSKITEVNKGEYFIDQQLEGPFKLWDHKHSFTSVPDGVLVQDHVQYALPFGFLGSIAHALFVEKQVADLFKYRTRQLVELFK